MKKIVFDVEMGAYRPILISLDLLKLLPAVAARFDMHIEKLTGGVVVADEVVCEGIFIHKKSAKLAGCVRQLASLSKNPGVRGYTEQERFIASHWRARILPCKQRRVCGLYR